MKIAFNHSPEGYQQAQKLRTLLDECYNNNPSTEVHQLIDELRQQVNDFLARHEATGTDKTFPFFDYFSSFWDFITAPSRRELELSKQRKDLIERAEHAESIAFQALAESSDLKQEHEQTLHKLHELEQEFARIRTAGRI